MGWGSFPLTCTGLGLVTLKGQILQPGNVTVALVPISFMHQTRRVSFGSKGTAHLTQADVRQGVSKFSDQINIALVPGLCQPPHP